MKLAIVESPTKSKTIKKFLGNEYEVVSSYGHVRDLPKSKLGIDVENGFKPQYIVPAKARKNVKALKDAAKKAESVILATDEDREGEAIAWHLKELLELENPERIVFHEITESAIKESLKKPRKIDNNLVDAQQARRILDRLVGYKLSPFLWKKVARGLSAGRVQSVAVRLIAEKEKEIKEFKSEEYWKITAILFKEKEFEALLVKINEKAISKLDIKTKEEAEKINKELEGAKYEVLNVEKKKVKKNPLPPFTTSTLQQELSKKFRLSAKATMAIAQRLYENGLITYHRTDSLNLSEQSLFSAKSFIEENFGKEYFGGFRKYKSKGKTQEAHEAIRPTSPEKTPESLKNDLDNRFYKVYDLIWKRFIASQMKEAIFNSLSVDIKAGDCLFKANGQTLEFLGFLKVYPIKFEEKELPNLNENDILKLIKINLSQHFTKPPSRYNEASLIKALEENGIGRPSTYAPIISTIQDRNYVEKNEDRRFFPTEMGLTVNNILMEHFPQIVDINFTAKMERELDEVAEGKDTLEKTCRDFYEPFSKNLEEKYEEVSKKEFTEKPTGENCPECKSPIIIRLGRFGKFYACSSFPKCRYTKPIKKTTIGIKCPKCKEGELVEKRTKRKKIFYGCNKYPECDFALWDKPTGEKCKDCDSLLIEKKNQIKCSNKDCKSNKKG